MSKCGKSIPSVLTQPMSEHRRCFLQIVLVVRSELRGYFGEHFADHWGFFTDRHMCSEIHRFADWIDYPKGDRVLKEHSSPVYAAAISSDGRFVFAGLNDGFISMFDLLTNELVRAWKAHLREVWSLAHHSSGLLISGAGDSTILLWNSFDECKLIRSFTGHSNSVFSLRFNPKATHFLSGSFDRSIRLWSVKKGECVREFTGHSGSVYSALLINDRVIGGGSDLKIKIWKSDHSECEREISDGISGLINKLCINSDSTLIAALFNTGFSLFQLPEMEFIRTVSKSASYGQFHPINPHLLAVGDRSDKSIKIYNVMSEECVRTLGGHSGNLVAVCFTPDGCRIVSASIDKTTRIWDTSDI